MNTLDTFVLRSRVIAAKTLVVLATLMAVMIISSQHASASPAAAYPPPAPSSVPLNSGCACATQPAPITKSGLASTGSQVVLAAIAGGAVVIVGGYALLAGRRRVH